MTAQQLRNAILQEAIQGRLVPQDPNDEPASVLLDRIRKEKQQLVKEGKLKKKDLEEKPISEEEIPFEIPESWEWVRMQDVILFVNGRAYKQEELLTKGKYKVLRVGNFFTNDSWYYSDMELPDEKYCYKEDLLYAWSASFGPKIWDGEKTIFHYHIWNVKYNKDILYRDYLYYFFLIDREKIKGSTTGSTMIHVSMENMKPRLIPIPPLAEQKRIVAKIEELLPKVEEYGKAQDALNKLNEELPERLKKSILQEAIEGRLVPQDPNDEPASVLLAKIRKEKEQLVKEGKLKKKDLEEKPISEDEIPFEIPESWEWCKLKSIGYSSLGKTLDRGKAKGELKPYLCTINVYWGEIDLKIVKSFQLEKDEQNKYLLKKGDLLICEGGDYGRAAVWNEDVEMYYQNALHRVRFYGNVNPTFYRYYIEYCKIAGMLEDLANGMTIKHFTQNGLFSLPLPLPPLAEQKRIVEKIEQLFKEIDKLKK